MYKVRVETGGGEGAIGMLSQLPNHGQMSKDGRYCFYMNGEIDNPDFWIIRNKYIKKPTTCHVAKENTILMLSEPEDIVHFPQSYLDQFGMVFSCQESLHHRNVIYGPPALPWLVGVINKGGKTIFTHSYDEFKNNKPETHKTKLISVITSNKAYTKGHRQRIDFVRALKEYYGDKLDVFGRGFNTFDDKWDVLSPYKYHIAIENGSHSLYWTEKISDCFLANTFPIYYGCKNINDYFPNGGVQSIDIQDFNSTISIIDKTINSDTWENKQDTLSECKNLVLDKYNIFDLMTMCCDKLNANAAKEYVTLKPASKIPNLNIEYHRTIGKFIWQIKNRLK